MFGITAIKTAFTRLVNAANAFAETLERGNDQLQDRLEERSTTQTLIETTLGESPEVATNGHSRRKAKA